MAKKTSSGTKSSKSMKKGETRTAPKKTAEYMSKYANKNAPQKVLTSSNTGANRGSNEAKIKILQNAIARSGDPTGTRAAAIARLQADPATQTTQVMEGSQSGSLASSEAKQQAIAYIDSLDLSTATKEMYAAVINGWDPNTELNPTTIIQSFEKIAKETIDPYWEGQANLAINSIKNSMAGMEAQRALELESQNTNAAQDVKNTQANLEASGLTFSGEGINQLGSDTAAAIPFGGTNVEGLVKQRNRLISTSSEAAYKQNLKNLGLSAEEQLGSSKAKSLVSGYNPAGSVEGTIATGKQSAYGSTLGNLINQQSANAQQDYALDV